MKTFVMPDFIVPLKHQVRIKILAQLERTINMKVSRESKPV